MVTADGVEIDEPKNARNEHSNNIFTKLTRFIRSNFIYIC